ncbi:acyltransferase family protein [Anaerocolumna sp. MB42-C2]|uniref:acyltransferase family protein n=1 Tax=Anaerocolumna sp. MB42-C2 TaxID=3070997 RepID=UPI0027DFB8D8|nr:acyltransferase [Anaerocolumna sp. MB42-C2]WMJ85821.1 acyltransferase [Anaerocolumna sp. MB42-C2]
MQQERNNSIDMFRLLASLMVVIIHTELMTDINQTIGFIMTQVIPRIAVPFFFCTSGYFYIKKIINKKMEFITTMKKLVLVYSLWSLVYFASDLLRSLHNETSIRIWVINCLKNYFIYGSSYQLWFFPALFFCIIIASISYKFGLLKMLGHISLLLYIIGCLGCSYYSIGNRIPVISLLINSQHFTLIRRVVLMGLPFYILGYWINIFENKISIKKLNIKLIICIVMFLLEIYFVVNFKIQKSIVITIFLYVLLAFVMIFLLKHPFFEKSKSARIMRGIGNFIFYTHPLYIMIITKAWDIIFDGKIETIVLYIITISSSGLCGYIIIKINNKFLNQFIY